MSGGKCPDTVQSRAYFKESLQLQRKDKISYLEKSVISLKFLTTFFSRWLKNSNERIKKVQFSPPEMSADLF